MMVRDKYAMVLLAVFTILNSLHVISLVSLSLSGHTKSVQTLKKNLDKTKIKTAGGGTYKTKEEIESAPSEDHDCNLTKTSVRITFPELKGELFVNLLGYKEPNLIRLMQCKGHCRDANSRIACVPTRVEERVVNMVVRSHLQGQESKQRYKDVIMEEHLECGCQCKDVSEAFCSGTLNARTCSCECDDLLMKPQISACLSRVATYWDYSTCQCRLKITTHDCVTDNDDEGGTFENRTVDILSFTFLGSCLTMVVFLTGTTWHYRNKLRMMIARVDMVEGQGKVSSVFSCDQYDSDVEERIEECVMMECDGDHLYQQKYEDKIKSEVGERGFDDL